MHFDTQAYFDANHESGFYPYVNIVFAIGDQGDHYHIPLLLTAYVLYLAGQLNMTTAVNKSVTPRRQRLKPKPLARDNFAAFGDVIEVSDFLVLDRGDDGDNCDEVSLEIQLEKTGSTIR